MNQYEKYCKEYINVPNCRTVTNQEFNDNIHNKINSLKNPLLVIDCEAGRCLLDHINNDYTTHLYNNFPQKINSPIIICLQGHLCLSIRKTRLVDFYLFSNDSNYHVY